MRTHADWVAAAAGLSIAGGHFIDGRIAPAASGQTFDCVSPADGRVIAQLALGDSADVDAAVANALMAWRDRRWRGLAPRARMDVLLRFADRIETHRDELALLETLDMGKPISDVLNIDIPEVLRTIRYFAECIDKIEGAVTHTDASAQHTIVHEPLGIVGAITPWNYPMLMAMWKVAPILAAGNCVVLKPSEQAPLTCTRLAQLFIDAGGPAGVFNVVNGLGTQAGKALALHPDVSKLSFTGSTAASRSYRSLRKICGLLPPVSSATRFMFDWPAYPSNSFPTAVEPVKDSLTTSGCSASALPASDPKPFTTLNTPAGPRASTNRAARRRHDMGAFSAGLSTTQLPAARIGAIFHTAISIG